MSTRFERVGPDWEHGLADLFRALHAVGDEGFFHPHPLTAAQAAVLARYNGADVYVVLAEGQAVVAYGMLRGWDEGFEIPSLGIAVHPKARGRGLGRRMMYELHRIARSRGASRVRLKVYPTNGAAVRLYTELGYRFESLETGELLGTLVLGSER